MYDMLAINVLPAAFVAMLDGRLIVTKHNPASLDAYIPSLAPVFVLYHVPS